MHTTSNVAGRGEGTMCVDVRTICLRIWKDLRLESNWRRG